MQYAINAKDNVLQLTISGRLTFSEAPQFSQVLAELEKTRAKGVSMEIQLGKLEFIDSTGMSLFVHIYDWTQNQGTKVTIHNASGPVYAALDRAAFNTLFEFK